MRRLSFGAVMAALLASLAFAAPAAAAAQVAGVYTRWQWDDGGGLAQMRFAGSTDAHLLVGASGLQSSQAYNVIGRTIGCGGTPSPSNRTFQVGGMTDAEGALWIDELSVPTNGVTRSMWFKQVGGGPQVCGISFNFDKMEFVGATNADFIIGTLPKKHVIALLEQLSNGEARYSIFHGAFEGAFILRSSLANKGCDRYPSTIYEKIDIGGADMNVFRWRQGTVNPGTMDGTFSVRLRNLPDGPRLGCTPMKHFVYRDV